jgi:hypothetical protein
MDRLERLAYWKSVAVDAVRAARRVGVREQEPRALKIEDDLFGFFDWFRPDGAGLEKVFVNLVGGDEILQRTRTIYELNGTSTESGDFVVHRPRPATLEKLLDLTTQHLEKMRQIARSLGEGIVTELEVRPEIEIKREAIAPRTQSNHYTPEADIYDVTGGWFGDLRPLQSEALLLGEAFFSIASDYRIAHHLLWPLYRHSTQIDEPFAPYFELWTHGAMPFFGKPGLVTLYVTGDS